MQGILQNACWILDMGHIRLARLPATKRWEEVVELLRAGGSISQLAAATAHAAETELQSAKGDPALAYTVWLLTQLPLAARSQQFRERLVELGFEVDAAQSVLALVAGFSLAVDRNTSGRSDRTDLGELARQAAAESLSLTVGSATQSLFGVSADDVQRELGRLATKKRFARLAGDFFARLTQKTLEYYVSRELPNHVGHDKNLQTIDRQIEFRMALERHCREAAQIVEEFAGGWYSKSNFQRTLTPATAQGFANYALKKMRDELRKRRSSNG
jgi:hypothetical protein